MKKGANWRRSREGKWESMGERVGRENGEPMGGVGRENGEPMREGMGRANEG